MRLESYLCFAGVELSNGARVATYVSDGGISEATMRVDCQCGQLDTGFVSPSADPAPWYESTRSESSEFLGLYITNMTLPSVMTRTVSQKGTSGSVLSSLRPKGRTIEVTGLMLSTSPLGQAYGERWLTEALRGSPCNGGDCATDDAIVLPACAEDEYDPDSFFRTLVNTGLVDGPIFVQIGTLPECRIQEVSFLLASSSPYLFWPEDNCIAGDPMDSYTELSCSLTTPSWMGEGTYIIDIANVDVVDVTDVVITGRISLDGTCPVTGDGTSVPPSFVYTIPTLAPDDRIVIDGARRQVLYYDASSKVAVPGLSYIDFDGPWIWPDVGTCTTMCLTIECSDGESVVTVDTMLREY